MMIKRLTHLLRTRGLSYTVWRGITKFQVEHGYPVAYFKPRDIWLEVTNRCNTICRHCDRNYRKFELGDMSVELFNKVRDNLFASAERVNLQGFGEPLLARHFDYFYSEVVRYRLKPAFTSNGILLDAINMERFVKDGAELTVSLDGATKETFNIVRPKIDFDDLINKLRYLSNMKSQYNDSGFYFRLNFVIMRDNMEELPAMFELGKTFNIDEILVFNLVTADFMDEFKEQSVISYPEETCLILDECKAKAAKTGILFSYPLYRFYEPEKAQSGDKLPICCMPWRSIYIDYKGNVKPCCLHYYPAIGNIEDGDIMKIWNNSAYQALRRSVNSERPSQWCRNCGVPPRLCFEDVKRKDNDPWEKPGG